MRLTKAISWSHAKFGADAEKHVSDNAKKTLVEVTQLLESVLEQSSKSGMIGLTYEALKTKPQMRKVHQIKVRREVLEELQEFNKEKGNDNDELRNFAARFNSLQLEQKKISGDSTARVPRCCGREGCGGCQEGQARSEETKQYDV